MTVGELKALLTTADDTWLIVLAADAEGNKFSVLHELDDCQYTPGATWYGEVKTPDYDNAQDLEEWDPAINKVNAICLWPAN